MQTGAMNRRAFYEPCGWRSIECEASGKGVLNRHLLGVVGDEAPDMLPIE
jgi:hypothetical protein